MKGAEACYKCRFFFVTKTGGKPEFVEGYCKRFPPGRIDPESLVFIQPIILGLNWCGEFKPEEKEKCQAAT